VGQGHPDLPVHVYLDAELAEAAPEDLQQYCNNIVPVFWYFSFGKQIFNRITHDYLLICIKITAVILLQIHHHTSTLTTSKDLVNFRIQSLQITINFQLIQL